MISSDIEYIKLISKTLVLTNYDMQLKSQIKKWLMYINKSNLMNVNYGVNFGLPKKFEVF